MGDYELSAKDSFSMEPVQDASDVPVVSYNLHRIADLEQIAQSTGREDVNLSDVMGICKSYGEVQNITSRNGKELTKREIVLMDSSQAEVTLTLWGDTAVKFDGSSQPVVAVKNARVSTYNGCTLTGGGATTAPKRPSENTSRQGPPAKAPTPSAAPPVRTSVMQPRPATGGAAPVVTPIASLTPYQNKWTIKARVTSKGDIRTWNKSTGSGKLFSFDLMDDSGEIRVTAFNEQCDRFYEVAQAGQVFYIANCTVKSATEEDDLV